MYPSQSGQKNPRTDFTVISEQTFLTSATSYQNDIHDFIIKPLHSFYKYYGSS